MTFSVSLLSNMTRGNSIAKKNLNGSTKLLAEAMRKVFSEAAEDEVEPLRADLDAKADSQDDTDAKRSGQ